MVGARVGPGFGLMPLTVAWNVVCADAAPVNARLNATTMISGGAARRHVCCFRSVI